LKFALMPIFVQLAGRHFGSKLIPNRKGVPEAKMQAECQSGAFLPIYTPDCTHQVKQFGNKMCIEFESYERVR